MVKASRILVGAVVVAGVAALVWLLRADASSRGAGPIAGSADSRSPVTLEAPGLSTVREPAPSATQHQDSGVGESVAYRGVVLDLDGGAIQEAKLTLHATITRGKNPLASATSDTDGRFVIRVATDPRVEGSLTIWAEADGFAERPIHPVKPEKEVEIRLRRATEIVGVVLDDDTGAPIAGADLACELKRTTSDAQGSYLFRGVAVGVPVTVRARNVGYLEQETRVLIDRPVPADVDFRLRRGQALRVEVFDAITGVPLAGAKVVGGDPRTGLQLTTNANGAFEVRVAEGEQLSLQVTAEKYASFRWSWKVLDLGDPKTPRIPMKGLAWIEGVVTGPEGTPTANTYLHASNPACTYGLPLTAEEKLAHGLSGDARWMVREREGKSDAEGCFRIPVLPMVTPYTLLANRPDCVPTELGPVLLDEPGESAHLDVKLHKGATIHGRVHCNGLPYTEGDVIYQDELGNRGGYARIDVDGRYELDGVPAGRVALSVLDPLTRAPQPPVAELRVEEGRQYEQDFAWTEELGTISGRVVDPRGAPVTSQVVTARQSDVPDGRQFQTETNVDGHFSVGVTRAGTYDVRAYRDTTGDVRRGIHAGTEDIVLVLPDMGLLRLRLVDASTGEPVRPREHPLWSLAWRKSGAPVFTTIRKDVSHDGRVELRLPVGAVDLAFHLVEEGYAPRQVPGIQVTAAGNDEPIAIELQRGLEVKLSLSGDSSVDGFRGHLLFLLHETQLESLRGPFPEQGGSSNHRINGINMWVAEPGLLDQMLELEPTGLAVLRGLPPGRCTLRCFPDDFDFEPASFELREPSSSEERRASVEIRWRSK